MAWGAGDFLSFDDPVVDVVALFMSWWLVGVVECRCCLGLVLCRCPSGVEKDCLVGDLLPMDGIERR